MGENRENGDGENHGENQFALVEHKESSCYIAVRYIAKSMSTEGGDGVNVKCEL